MSTPPEPADDGQHTEPVPGGVPVKIEEAIAAVTMALICCITFANVVVRYLTNASFAFTEEFTVFLMVVLTLVGSAAAFARNRHIRMTFLTDRLSPPVARKVELLVMLMSALMFALLAWYGWKLFLDDWQYDTTSPGIGIPQWIYTIFLPLLSVVILLRIVGRTIRLLKGQAGREGQEAQL
ncbi:MAG: Tripartite ATP-independent periplasmic transporter DctQ component [Paucimonas sp.]|nr:Tripartite ATP-independent periplasmic transporter DctQ component [Paucimonas sp.]